MKEPQPCNVVELPLPRRGARREKWPGGYVRHNGRGVPVYVIRAAIAGKDYCVSTRRNTLEHALLEWHRFQVDPDAYDPRGASADRRPPVLLDEPLIGEYLRYCAQPAGAGGPKRGNGQKWLATKRGQLAWWSRRLAGQNLRGLRTSVLSGLMPPGTRGYAPKIRVIKHLYTFLRTSKFVVEPSEDPTFGKLRSPQSAPGAGLRAGRKRFVPPEEFEKVSGYLSHPWVDALCVQAGTGWHATEVIAFMESGAVEPAPARPEKGVVAVLLTPRHKGGGEHRTRVSQRVLDAAERLLRWAAKGAWGNRKPRLATGGARRRGFTQEAYIHNVQRACALAEVNPFTPGCMRHTVATWAGQHGTPIASISDFLGHREGRKRTTAGYMDRTAPPKIPTYV